MPLPEIPESWFRLITALTSAIAAIAASIAVFISHNNNSGINVIQGRQVENSQKLDAAHEVATQTAAKVDKAEKSAAVKLDSIADKTEKVAQKVGAMKE